MLNNSTIWNQESGIRKCIPVYCANRAKTGPNPKTGMTIILSFPLLMIFFACLMLFPLANATKLLYIYSVSGSQARIRMYRGLASVRLVAAGFVSSPESVVSIPTKLIKELGNETDILERLAAPPNRKGTGQHGVRGRFSSGECKRPCTICRLGIRNRQKGSGRDIRINDYRSYCHAIICLYQNGLVSVFCLTGIAGTMSGNMIRE